MSVRKQPAPTKSPQQPQTRASALRGPASVIQPLPAPPALALAHPPLQPADLLALQRSLGNRVTTRLLAQRRPARSRGAPLVQRVIVRVGYDDQKMQSWNKFVKSPHAAVKAKVDLLAQAAPQDQIDDYKNNQLVTAKQGNIGTTLHVVGHGKPGIIAGVDAGTLADNIKISLANQAGNINSIKLHSCFSNIPDNALKTTGGKFSEKFANASVVAASGIHFADTATNLPARYTGFKFAASIAKQKLLADQESLASDTSNDAQEQSKINNIFNLIAKATNPLEKFAKEKFVKYNGLDPSGEKTQENESVSERWLKYGVNLDAMPRTAYPSRLDSIIEGLKETYIKMTSDIGVASSANPGKRAKLDELQQTLNAAYLESVQNYQALEQAVDMLQLPFAFQDP